MFLSYKNVSLLPMVTTYNDSYPLIKGYNGYDKFKYQTLWRTSIEGVFHEEEQGYYR